MIYICTNKDLKNALAYVEMAVDNIPRRQRRKRNDRALEAFMRYFEESTFPTVNDPGTDIPIDVPVKLAYESSIQLGTHKWPDIRRTYYISVPVTIYKVTDQSICYFDTCGGKKHMLLSSVSAIITADPA